jgi:hypothetical protein
MEINDNNSMARHYLREANESKFRDKYMEKINSVYHVNKKPLSVTRKLFPILSKKILQKFACQLRYIRLSLCM